jgi:hypothetical protein
MIKAIASAVFLAVFILAPAQTASAGAGATLDCVDEEWLIQGDKASDLALTITNGCNDIVSVFLIGKKGPKDLGTVLPDQTKTFLTKVKSNESVRVEGNGTGSYSVTLEVQK